MRLIGSVPNEELARTLADYLVSKGIHNEVEGESDGSWSVWIRDEDHVAAAAAELRRFSADPRSSEFRDAAVEAERVRQAEAADLAAYNKRIRTRRSLFPKFGGYGVGMLTYAMIVGCVAVAFLTKLGSNDEILRHLFITDPDRRLAGDFLPEVFAGEIWRLWTPMFVHSGPIHLIFNLLWVYQLGAMIEGRQGLGKLAALVLISGLLSNLAQHVIGGSIRFGGMSGVVYALAGYVWMRGKYDRGSGLYLDPRSVTILLVWLVICFTGLVGLIGNAAHVSGLMIGVIWGRLSAYYASSRPE